MHFTTVSPNNTQEIISVASLVRLILRNFGPSTFFARNKKILRMLLIQYFQELQDTIYQYIWKPKRERFKTSQRLKKRQIHYRRRSKKNSSHDKHLPHNPATTSTSSYHILRGDSPTSLNPMSCVPIYVPSKKKENHFSLPMKFRK